MTVRDQGIENAVAKVLLWNTVIAGLIAAVVVVCFAAFSIVGILTDTSLANKVPEELSNWGGVIIGFYFGSALTQAGSLISAIRGRDPNGSKTTHFSSDGGGGASDAAR